MSNIDKYIAACNAEDHIPVHTCENCLHGGNCGDYDETLIYPACWEDEVCVCEGQGDSD